MGSFFVTKIKGKLSASASLLPPSCFYHVLCYLPKHFSPRPKKRRLEKFFPNSFSAGLALLLERSSADPAAMASVRLLGPDLREPLIIQDLDVNQTIEHLKERALGQWPSGAPPAAKLLLVCFVTGWPVHSHAVLFTRRRDGRAIDRAGEDHPPGPLPGGQDAPERCVLRAVNSALRLRRRSSWLRLAGCAQPLAGCAQPLASGSTGLKGCQAPSTVPHGGCLDGAKATLLAGMLACAHPVPACCLCPIRRREMRRRRADCDAPDHQGAG